MSINKKNADWENTMQQETLFRLVEGKVEGLLCNK